MKKIFASIFLLASVIGSSANAQELFAPSYEQYELANGLKVVLYRDTTLPVVAVNVAYRVGSGDEKPGKSGVANLLGAMLLQGSQHISGKQLLKTMDECDASFGGSVDVDRTDFWSIFPSHCIETALWIESDRMGFSTPIFTKIQVDSLKKRVLREQEQAEKNPGTIIKREAYAGLYPPMHPYSWLTSGAAKDVAKITFADVTALARSSIVPNNASITIGGDIDVAAAKELVKKYFGDIPRGPERAHHSFPPLPRMLKGENIVIEQKTDAAKLTFIFHTQPLGSSEEPALHVLARLLAGDRTSRLVKSLIYQQRIASDVQAYQSSQFRGGTFWIVVTCPPEANLQKVYNSVMLELDQIGSAPPDDDERETMINRVTLSSLVPLENLGGFGGRVDALNLGMLYSGKPSYAFRNLNSFARVSSAEISLMVQKYLRPEKCVTVNLLPPKRGAFAVKL